MKTKLIKEGDTVIYRDDFCYKLKGKVIHIYTSLAGLRCVHINNFYLTRLIDDITLDEANL